MKLQCACGAKYEFDAKPEMLQNPVRFVCQGCGLDSSEFVNELIRREFGGPPPSPTGPSDTPKLRIAHSEPQPAEPIATAPESAHATEYCPKHLRELAVHHCVVCGRPMCRQCMELFGYLCSPLCRAKAEAQNIDVPIFEGQKTVMESRYWRKAGIIGSIAGGLIAAALIFWFWYAWIGSVPHTVFSVHFDAVAYSGESKLCGTNQIIFLHGGTLARYDIKSGNEIWTKVLVTPRQIADRVAVLNQFQPASRDLPRTPQSELEKTATRELEGRLQLQVSGENVWVSTPDRLTHYDWNTGRVLQEIPLPDSTGTLIARDGEFLMMGEAANGETTITHINPANGEFRLEEIGRSGRIMVAATTGAGSISNQPTGGLPLAPGADHGTPMDPAKVGQQAQSIGVAGRIALPALVANSEEEERIESELDDNNQTRSAGHQAQRPESAQKRGANFFLIPSPYGYVEMAVSLVKLQVVTREAMRPSSGKSALSGNLSTANETEVANEMLNQMQRDRGGGTVEEDQSLYQVSLRRPGSVAEDWTGEVTGPPALYSLKTVNVLAAGKTLIVFDKTNKKMWQAALTYNVPDANRAQTGDASTFGEGPCVEHGGILYVFDQAVLTAFDVATGNARWRVPTVGVVGLFFDHHGKLYVNTTTADPDNIRYSRQIDITQRIDADLLKIDPQSGKILWNIKPGGFISYLADDFIYTVETYVPTDDENKMADMAGITPNPPHIKIRRINPDNGQVMWEYYEADKGAPLDVQFHDNSIRIVFSREVDVMKYISL